MRQTAVKAENQSQEKIMDYFMQWARKSEQSTCLFLPSIMRIARTLHCPAVDVHATMRAMAGQGFYFLVMGLDTPVTLRFRQQVS